MKRKRVIFLVGAIYVLAWLFTMQMSPSSLAGDVERRHESVYRGWARISNVDVLVFFSPAPFIQRVEWTLHWKADGSFKSHGEVCRQAWILCVPGLAWSLSEETLWATK
jgi:hypothetical protein